MRTNIVLDDKLMEEAFSLSDKKTKKDLVQEALEEYVANRKIKNLLDLEGKIEFSEGYDYKEMRESK
jgi:Arc/MetJ family transcription regulator